MNYWMLTISQDNFAVTRSQGWRIQGFTRSQRRKTDRMQPGDRLLLYVREPRGFGGTATITSPSFNEDSVLWHVPEPEETFPHRVRIRPEATLKEGQYAGAIELAPRMEYLRRWPPERWPLAFIGELHLLPRLDFELIEGEIQRMAGGRPRRPREPRRGPGPRQRQDRPDLPRREGAPGPAQGQEQQREAPQGDSGPAQGQERQGESRRGPGPRQRQQRRPLLPQGAPGPDQAQEQQREAPQADSGPAQGQEQQREAPPEHGGPGPA